MDARSRPEIVVRVAGLPVAALDDLRAHRTLSAVRTVLAHDARLARLGRGLADGLHEVIGAHDGSPLKPWLVALRRALHNGRLPAPRACGHDVRDALPPALRDGLADWLVTHRRREAAVAGLPALLAADDRENDARLRRWAAEPAFATTLVDANPDLAADVDDPRTGAGPLPPLMSMRLTRYLARAAAKTSPFGAFLFTGPAAWEPGPGVLTPTGSWCERVAVEPDLALLDELARAPRPLRVNPTATEHGGRVWFVPAGWDERVVGLTPGAAVRDALAGEPGPVRDRLAELGLLEPEPPFGDQEHDPLGCLARRDPALAPLHRAVTAYGETRTATARRRLRADLARELPGADRRNVVHTSGVLTAVPATVGAAAWAPIVEDLDVVRRLLGPFRASALIDAVAPEVCADLLDGGERPFLIFHRDLLAALRPAGPDSPAGQLRHLLHAVGARPQDWRLRPGPTQALHDLRVHTRQQLWKRGGDGPDGHAVPVADVEDLMRAWPAGTGAARSMSFFVQAGDDGGLVVNGVGPGHGAVAARTRRLLGGHGAVPGPVPADGPLFAEITGSYGSTLNLRTSPVSHEITCPGTTGVRDAARRIAFSELVVRAGADGVGLYRASDGRRVVPVHTGMMSPSLLPAAARVLFQLFGDDPGLAAPLRTVLGSRPEHTPEDVERHPRLTVGSLVLARASWWLPAARLPRRTADRAGYLLRLARLFRECGIPERSYVSTHDLGGGTGTGHGKPLYLDLATPYLVHALDVLASGADTLCFQECLPDPRRAREFGPGGRRVHELVVDLGVPRA